MKFKLTSWEHPKGVISQKFTQDDEGANNLSASIIEWSIDTRNASIREMLIKMGWTPPKTNESFYDNCARCHSVLLYANGEAHCSCGAHYMKSWETGLWHSVELCPKSRNEKIQENPVKASDMNVKAVPSTSGDYLDRVRKQADDDTLISENVLDFQRVMQSVTSKTRKDA